MAKITMTLAAVVAALFPTSEKAISEKLTQEEFNAFAAETQETQSRIDAQAEGNQALADDLTKANADLATAQAELATAIGLVDAQQADLAIANTTIAELTPKAAQWDGYKASLSGAQLTNDGTNGKPGADLSKNDKKAQLKAKYPLLTAGLDLGTEEE